MKDKANFVCNTLQPLLQDALTNVAGCRYEMTAEHDEYVHVTMENGCFYRIDVTADSLIALAADVIHFMKCK